MGYSNYGVSPEFAISGEDFQWINRFVPTEVDIEGVKPPEVGNGVAYSNAMNLWVQPWAYWNYEKITEPKYDGICQYFGRVSNKPDLIKDYHMIGIMRNVDVMIEPSVRFNIQCTVEAVLPQGPTTPTE